MPRIVTLHQFRDRIIGIILSISLCLWFITIDNLHISEFPADSFYFVKQLPIYYWLGIILAIFAFLMTVIKPVAKANNLINIILISVFVLYLFGTTSFIYTNPRFLDTYGMSDVVTWINDTGHLSGLSHTYLDSFPASTTFFSTSSQILGIEPLLFAKFYPIVSIFILVFIIYAIANRISPRYSIIAPITYLSLGWVQAYHMSPQNYALILSTVLLLLFTQVITCKSSENKVTKRALIIIFWSIIIFCHAATPLLIIFAFLALFITYSVYSLIKSKGILKSMADVTRTKAILSIIPLFIVSYLAYILFQVDFVFIKMVTWFETTINNILQGETFALIDRNVTTPADSYALTTSINWMIIVATLVLGIVYIAYLFLGKKESILSLMWSSFFVGFMGFSVWLVLSGFSLYGADRGYIFGIIAFSILAVIVLDSSVRQDTILEKSRHSKSFRNMLPQFIPILTILFIVISALIIPITRYNSDPYGFVSESDMAARNFIEDHPGLGEQIDYRYYGAPLMFTTYSYNLLELKQLQGQEYIDNFNSVNLNRMFESGQVQIYVQK